MELSRERVAQQEVSKGDERLLQVHDVECEALEKSWEGGDSNSEGGDELEEG